MLGNQMMRAIFDAAVDSLLIIDEDGVIQALNSPAVRAFGYADEDELLGRNVSMLMPSPDRELHDSYIRAYLKTGRGRIIGLGRSMTAKRFDGTTFPVHVSISEFEHEGRRLFAGIVHDESARAEFAERINWMATHDDLTGALNRRGMEAHIESLLGREDGGRFAVLVLDIDSFRLVNDNHGHRVGDQLLVGTAERIRQVLGPDDVFARIGADEFIVAAPITSDSDAEALAHQLAVQLEAPFHVDGIAMRMTASLGLSVFPDHADDGDSLVSRADMAMTEAKRRVGTTVNVFDRSLQEQSDAEYRLVTRLREAIDDDRLVLHYQPQFSLTTCEVTGLEALVRWDDQETGLVPPDEFLPIAQQHGLMARISEWVLRRACLDNAELIARGAADVPVAVNIDPPLFADASFVPLIQDALAESGLAPDRLEIEVVEGIALNLSPQLTHNITALQEMGVTITMDDFGTGYSSMMQLASLRFDRVKIDRGFVAELPDDRKSRALVTAVLGIAFEFEIEAVAEGIETDQQRVFLEKSGCRVGQGYLHQRPVPFPDLLEHLAAKRPCPEA